MAAIPPSSSSQNLTGAVVTDASTAPAELVKTLVQEQLPTISRGEQEQALVSEYQALIALERQGRLSPVQAQRRREVETALEEREAQDPTEQEAERRLRRPATNSMRY